MGRGTWDMRPKTWDLRPKTWDLRPETWERDSFLWNSEHSERRNSKFLHLSEKTVTRTRSVMIGHWMYNIQHSFTLIFWAVREKEQDGPCDPAPSPNLTWILSIFGLLRGKNKNVLELPKLQIFHMLGGWRWDQSTYGKFHMFFADILYLDWKSF